MCMRRSWCGGDLVRCLLQNGWTALIWASYNRRLEVVKALLAAGADRDAKDNVRA